jgi:hypothetical protein
MERLGSLAGAMLWIVVGTILAFALVITIAAALGDTGVVEKAVLAGLAALLVTAAVRGRRRLVK